MSMSDKLGYFVGGFIMTSVWILAAFTYLSHIVFTFATIGSVEHSGQAFYLVAGIFFPPLGVFNGLFIWLA